MFVRNPDLLAQNRTVKFNRKYNVRTLQHYRVQIANIIDSTGTLTKLQKRLIINACKSIIYSAQHVRFDPSKKGYKYNQAIDATIKTVKPYVPIEVVEELQGIKTIN